MWGRVYLGLHVLFEKGPSGAAATRSNTVIVCTFISTLILRERAVIVANPLFQRFTESMLDEVLSWDPAQATQLGWRKYDSLMSDPSRESLTGRAERLKELMRDLEAFSDAQLSPDERIDRDLAVHLFKSKVFEIETLRMHEKMAQATEEIGNALFFLFFRDDGPLEDRMDAMISRLERVPEYLERSMETLVSPCKLWNEIALETGRQLAQFFDSIESHALDMFGRTERTARLSKAAVAARAALERYNRWLEETVIPVADGRCYFAPEVFHEYLRLKGFDMTPDEALKVGEAHLARTRDRMAEVARQIVGSGSVEEALERMKSDHPEGFGEVLSCYREEIRRARELLIAKDLATIPDGERLLVIETPRFMRHTAPFAAQYEPGKFTSDRTGLFLVTPSENLDVLRDHSRALICNTAVHEGYPGHHLQGICANTNPSFVRVLSASMDFGEGWALYCEELMLSQGYNDTPEGRMAQLSDLMFRVVRVIADVRLARGEMTAEQVADMIVRETGMQREAALSDAKSYTYCPTSYLSYFLGKMALLQLLEDVKTAMGDRFSLKFFHDTLLYAGCLPIPFMRRELALRLREEYGIDLGEPKERVYEFAMRNAS